MFCGQLIAGSNSLIAGEDDGVEHGLVEQAVAHPLRHDAVDLNKIRQSDKNKTVTGTKCPEQKLESLLPG